MLTYQCLAFLTWNIHYGKYVCFGKAVLSSTFCEKSRAESQYAKNNITFTSSYNPICAIIIAIYLVLKLRYDFWLSGLWSDQKTINFYPKDLHYINIFCHLAILQKHSLPPESIFERQFFHQLFVEYIYIFAYPFNRPFSPKIANLFSSNQTECKRPSRMTKY